MTKDEYIRLMFENKPMVGIMQARYSDLNHAISEIKSCYCYDKLVYLLDNFNLYITDDNDRTAIMYYLRLVRNRADILDGRNLFTSTAYWMESKPLKAFEVTAINNNNDITYKAMVIARKTTDAITLAEFLTLDTDHLLIRRVKPVNTELEFIRQFGFIPSRSHTL